MAENKFNFSEEGQPVKATPNSTEESKEQIKTEAKGLAASITKFLKDILAFRDDTDRDATVEAIKNDIPFKGATAWILICSIFVASIGLNANSTAVVIGAMLISPLMGPILGVGYSIAVNDIDILRKSLVNLGVMIVLSLITAFLFFYLFPLSEDTSELLGRTRPDIRDVLIAFFGGLALIIARTKRGTIASVIFGVAIATALMPPLCTAGYGLAIGNFRYFGGAMYLFGINTIFIALATFVVLKILRFPMQKYANSKKRRFISRMATLLAIVVMIPAVWTFLNVLTETGYESDYKKFFKKNIESNDALWLQRQNLDMDKKVISLYFNGDVTEATEISLQNSLKDYENIHDFELRINTNKLRSTDLILQSYDRAIKELEEKDYTIQGLKEEISKLEETIDNLAKNANGGNNGNFVFSSLAKEAKEKFPGLDYLSVSRTMESSDFSTVDTLTVVGVKWEDKVADSLKTKNESEIVKWLDAKFNTKKIQLLRK
ncbi:DUF389 domain-containing protein [Aegicerativicinus sediminis]|uniref:DUF389 domain-containing protein n=1 Tax=Aegicerativicinus sediminis TaxID=2893202 RepID=UPI001E2B2407|nr:DUF389 domain-containing protein [Aegicerativicinus sediminis]